MQRWLSAVNFVSSPAVQILIMDSSGSGSKIRKYKSLEKASPSCPSTIWTGHSECAAVCKKIIHHSAESIATLRIHLVKHKHGESLSQVFSSFRLFRQPNKSSWPAAIKADTRSASMYCQTREFQSHGQLKRVQSFEVKWLLPLPPTYYHPDLFSDESSKPYLEPWRIEKSIKSIHVSTWLD